MAQHAVRILRVASACAAATLALSACVVSVDSDATQYTAREEKRFAVTGPADLNLRTFDGSVEIRSWDKAEILVEVEKRAADKTLADAIEVKTAQSGGAVTVDVRRPVGSQAAFGFRISPSARIVASVPRRCNLVVYSGDGSITIERVEGRLDLTTGDGTVRGIDLAGTLRARTGDGSMRFENVSGAVDVETGDGGARLSGTLESVRLRTGDGSVEVRAEAGSAMTADWEIRTGDGGLRLEVPAGFSAMLDAETGDGAVRVRGFGEPAGGVSEGEDRSLLRRTLGAGGRLLRLRSESGTISVTTL